MRNTINAWLFFLLISSVFATEFSVQGVLRDPLGRTVDNGSYAVTFKMYDEASGSAGALWTELHGSVAVQHGVFSVLLGSITDMSALSFKEKYWIGISIAGGVEMSPRTQLTTSPYSKAVLGTDNIFPSVGRIGVGTTDPQAAFHVKNKNNETAILLIKDASDNEQVKVANDGTLSVPDGIFGNGELGVGTQDPTAAVHIISNNGEDKLRIDDSNGDPLVQVNSDGNLGINNPLNEAGASVIEHPLSINGNLRLYNGGVVLFDDGTQLASANFGGSATGVASPSNATINAGVGEGTGTIALNIDEEDKLVVSATTTDVNNNLVVDGTATFSSTVSLSSIDVAGNSALGGTLDVAGNSALGGTLVVAGASDLNGALDVAGNSDLNGDLDVTGDSELDGSLVVTGDSDLEGNLTVQTNSNLGGTLDVWGRSQIGGALVVAGASDLNGALDVAGASDLNGALDVSGKVNFSNVQDVALAAGTGSLSIGSIADLHISIDGNEIQARDESVGSVLNLQREGGDALLFNPNDFSNTQLFRVSGNTKFYTNASTQGTFDVFSSTNNNVMLSSGRNEYGYIGTSSNKWYSIHLTEAYSNNYSTYSDSRLKENIRFLNSEETLEKLLTLRGVQYDAKEGTPLFTTSENASPGDNENILGVIAQEVEKVFPGILGSESGGYKTVQYDKFVPVFIEAIKQIKIEKDKEIEVLKREYDALLARIVNLENQ